MLLIKRSRFLNYLFIYFKYMLGVWPAGLDLTEEASCLVATVCLLSAGMMGHHCLACNCEFSSEMFGPQSSSEQSSPS